MKLASVSHGILFVVTFGIVFANFFLACFLLAFSSLRVRHIFRLSVYIGTLIDVPAITVPIVPKRRIVGLSDVVRHFVV